MFILSANRIEIRLLPSRHSNNVYNVCLTHDIYCEFVYLNQSYIPKRRLEDNCLNVLNVNIIYCRLIICAHLDNCGGNVFDDAYKNTG